MKFPYGLSNFEQLRSEGYLYIDKTHYIELLESLPERHLVILRSRRFGKTLFANMLGWYYDHLHAGRFEAIFKGTYIYEQPTPKRNAYMILSFNFSGINTQTLENANEGFMVHDKKTSAPLRLRAKIEKQNRREKYNKKISASPRLCAR